MLPWMRARGLLLLSLIAFSSAGHSTPAPANRPTLSTDEEICSHPDAKAAFRIAACNRLIAATQDTRELSDLYNNRGTALAGAGDTRAAFRDYATAIRLNQDSAVPYVNRGDLYFRQGEYDKGISDFNAALARDTKFERAYMGRTLSLLRKNDQQGALRSVEEMVRNIPGSAIAVETKAYVLKALGRREQAIAEYRKALAMARDVLQLREEIKKALQQLGHKTNE